MSRKYRFQRYFLDNIFDDHSRYTTILIIGDKCSGKTTLGNKIIRRGGFEEGYVFGEKKESYDGISPNTVFMKTIDGDILQSIITRQKEKIKEIYAGKKQEKDDWCFVFIDDPKVKYSGFSLMGRGAIRNTHQFRSNYSEALKEVMLMSRHLKIFSLITISSNDVLSPALRCNLDVIFLMPGALSKRKVWENYGSKIAPRYEDYRGIYDQINNKRHRSVVVDYASGEYNNGVVYYHDTIDTKKDWLRFYRKIICLKYLNRKSLFPTDINRIIISFIGT